jgi:acyl-CoA thioesterase FadM
VNLFGRIIWLLLTFRFRSKTKFFEESGIGFRVWPSDLDTNMHMNNGVYLSVMDLARTDLVLRSGLMKVVKQNGWYPVVASQTIRYRRSLDLFRAFTVCTQLIGWDERFFYIQQKFMLGKDVAALALVKGRFLKNSGGGVYPGEIAEAMGESPESPKLADWVHQWTAAEDLGWKLSVGQK